MAAIVESFLRQVRQGGSLDPEPYLARAEELRTDLAPILANVLRLEALAGTTDDGQRPLGRDHGANAIPPGEAEGAS